MTTLPEAISGTAEERPRLAPVYPPTPEDWNNYRDVFTRLYRSEGRTLKDTKATMERLYGFRAT